MFFYLEWINKRPDKILILDEKPDNLTFIHEFKIKKEKYTICAKINEKFLDYYPSKIVYKKNQYLLSHLQKAVRRMDDIKSVKTAKHLIDLDCTSFLRRLPIIMLEDVTLYDNFPILIWLMIANTKGFQMKEEIVKWILGIVYHISRCEVKTYYENKSISEYEINDKKDIILNTLRFRKAYGGMKGDMNMIEYYTHLYGNKMIEPYQDKIPIVKLEMEPLEKSEWIYQANDFHCNRYILQLVKRNFSNYGLDYIKELIWIFSSSFNKRMPEIKYQKSYEKDWLLIKKTVIKIQKACKYY